MSLSLGFTAIAITLEGIYSGAMWISVLIMFYMVLWFFGGALIRFAQDKRKQKELVDEF